MDNGYIRLHRAITAWEWYDDVNTFKVFLHLLLTCNWQEKKWRGHTIYPGQRVVSLATLADETKLSIMQVRNTINHLVLTGSITRSKIGKVGLITVNNWEKYQQGNTVSNSEVTQNQNENQQRNNIEITTNEEREEGKERKKNITYPIVPPDVFEISGLRVPDDARGAQEQVKAWLEEKGFSCQLEVKVPARGDGRTGRLDILATRGSTKLAVEVDRGSPREKSIFKLLDNDFAKLSLVRNGEGRTPRKTQEGVTVIYLNATDVFAECAGGSQELLEALRKFAEMRKSIKKPMTERAKELLVKKLEKLAEPYQDKERYKLECVNQSILNSWQGLFPLKDFEDSAPAQDTVEMPDEWPTYKPGMSWEDLIP